MGGTVQILLIILIHVKFWGEWPALNKHSEKINCFTSSDYFHLHWPVYSLLDFYNIGMWPLYRYFLGYIQQLLMVGGKEIARENKIA